jgi:hypothetical protein
MRRSAIETPAHRALTKLGEAGVLAHTDNITTRSGRIGWL